MNDCHSARAPHPWNVGRVTLLMLFGLLTSAGHAIQGIPAEARDTVTLSVIGTTDLHGRVLPNNGRGGVALLGGYLHNLRTARDQDGGAVLLLDAGDTFEGGIESNLSEGSLVIDAYNALGYNALAIGNHEFDYGALDEPSANASADDMRGALKAAASRADFPFLAANLIDERTGQAVAWPNVQPSTLIETADVRVGIVGVMTYDALEKTLAAHVHGLATAPLASTVAREAALLRRRGAEVVLLVAHAGGWCGRVDDAPTDTSSCDDESEIFQLARQLPPRLVDAIVAGHTHAAVAHEVAGIPIVQAYSRGAAFARVDLIVKRGVGVVSAHIFPPQPLCTGLDHTRRCTAGGAPPPPYEGVPVQSDASVTAAMQPELTRVERWRQATLGVHLDRPFLRDRGELESPLGNTFAEAFLASAPDADGAIGMGARRGGLRADLPRGPLTRGTLYDVFPFDNRIVTLPMTSAELADVFERLVVRGRGGLPGISGMRVRVSCTGDQPQVTLLSASGVPVAPTEMLLVASTDFFATRARFGSGSMPPREVPGSAPLVRDAAAAWFTRSSVELRDAILSSPPRWEFPTSAPCIATPR